MSLITDSKLKEVGENRALYWVNANNNKHQIGVNPLSGGVHRTKGGSEIWLKVERLGLIV